ncbi:putative carbonic anhydrase 3 isoform X2 [Bicyclus anynana]|uniref:Carbonic anhydrase n=1 Tax=Bicyclus anynana TaxID=110368 RepID=A0ABM3LLD4_BICAN|nr:putative carbonic anhydrase 3 isoform X2 [Bicyclus anynana]
MGFSNGDDWSYEYETRWPGACTTGAQQSPINIMSRSAIVDKLDAHIQGPLVFRGYSNVNASAANDGHTLKWTIEEDEIPPVVSGGPLRGNYSFVQFHLHWLSEHAIDGMKYPMEIHLVHVKTGLTIEEAVERPDGLAVVGILAEVHSTSEENEFALGELEPALPYLLTRHEGSYPASVIDLSRMFSSNMQSFYTYHGSLTTPNCQEVVTWILMDRPIKMTDTQFKLFSKVDVGGINNYRSLQPVNRVIHRSRESSATVAIPSAFGLLAAVLNLSSSVTGVMSKGMCTLVNIKKRFFGKGVKDCSVAEALKNKSP